MEVTCNHCGARFARPPSQIMGRVFCNRECRKAFHRTERKCRGCGELFTVQPIQKNRQYCTWECFKASRHVVLTCRICGDEFESYLCEAQKRDDRGHVACCSRACRNVYTSRLLGGDGKWVPGGQYNSKRRRGSEWRKARNAYLKHVGGMCEGCEGMPATEVHHLMPTASGGDMIAFDNLMAVCGDCHKNMHGQIRDGAFWDSFEAVHAGY